MEDIDRQQVVVTRSNDDDNVNNKNNKINWCNNTTPNKANTSLSSRKIYNTRSTSGNNCSSIETTQKLLKEIIINDNTNDLKSSPRKRATTDNSINIESPSKRSKAQSNINQNEFKTCESPKPTISKFSLQKDTLSSTPKSKHKPNFENLCNKSDSKVEKNLSKNWIDMMEELEEQSKELNEYVDKVCSKYKMKEDEFRSKIETDTEVLRKRQKQINYGKLTEEYQRYTTKVNRKDRLAFYPKTPNKYRKCSRRKFDGLIKKWRKQLHMWDSNPDKFKESKSFDLDDDLEEGDDFGEDVSSKELIDIDSKFSIDDLTIATTISNSSSNNACNTNNDQDGSGSGGDNQ